MVGRNVSTLAEWARNIASLRSRLEMTQTELADRLGVTAMTISRWERGLVEPTASGYISLGNLAGQRDAWYFWRRAGLDETQVKRTLGGQKKMARAKAKGLGL
ncbi:MAG: helix-turn-helix transcriptional regulator [Terriglobales bacterium]